MKRSIRFVCLVTATLLFFTFTFAPAQEQRGSRERSTAPTPQTQASDTGKNTVAGGKKIAEPKSKATQFVRIKRDKKGEPQELQTAVVRYVPANAKSDWYVDLVSVVHVADRKYYDKLNKLFEDYDVVLYELVAPKGVKVPKGGKKSSDNPIAMIQDMMTMALQLNHQMRCIDYTCTNFVHADLSPDEMAAAIKKRGDNALSIILNVTADLIREQNKMALKKGKQPDIDPIKLMFDPQAPMKLKKMMAEQLADMADGSGLGKTLNQLLIDDRNAACMKVFAKQRSDGKKKIAIFYGAAHMPDFERRLVKDFGLRVQSAEWYTAWDLRPRPFNTLELLKFLK